MPLVIPPGFAHVALEFRHDLDPEPWYVTYGIDADGFGADLVKMGQQACKAFDDTFGPFLSSQVNQSGAQITLGQDGGAPIRTFVPNGLGVGLTSEPKLPQNCALLIRKNTGLGGRRNQGRMFLPGLLDEDEVTGTGVITPATVVAYSGLCLDWYTEITEHSAVDAVPSPMVLLHSEGISPVIEPTVITSLSPDNVISTQRRRLR